MGNPTYSTLDEFLQNLAVPGDSWPQEFSFRPYNGGQSFIDIEVPLSPPIEMMGENGEVTLQDFQAQGLQVWLQRNDQGGWDPVLLYRDQIQEILERQSAHLLEMIEASRAQRSGYDADVYGWADSVPGTSNRPVPDFNPVLIIDGREYSFDDFEVVDKRTGEVVEIDPANGFFSPDVFNDQAQTISPYVFDIRPTGNADGLPLTSDGFIDQMRVRTGVGWTTEVDGQLERVNPYEMGFRYVYDYDAAHRDGPALDTDETARLQTLLVDLEQSGSVRRGQVDSPDVSVPQAVFDNDGRIERSHSLPDMVGMAGTTGLSPGDAPGPGEFYAVDPATFAARLEQYETGEAPEGYDRSFMFVYIDYTIARVMAGESDPSEVLQTINAYPGYQDILSDYVARTLMDENPQHNEYVALVEARLAGEDVQLQDIDFEAYRSEFREYPVFDEFLKPFFNQLERNMDPRNISGETYRQARTDLEAFAGIVGAEPEYFRQQEMVYYIERNPRFMDVFVDFAQAYEAGEEPNVQDYVRRIDAKHAALGQGEAALNQYFERFAEQDASPEPAEARDELGISINIMRAARDLRRGIAAEPDSIDLHKGHVIDALAALYPDDTERFMQALLGVQTPQELSQFVQDHILDELDSLSSPGLDRALIDIEDALQSVLDDLNTRMNNGSATPGLDTADPAAKVAPAQQ